MYSYKYCEQKSRVISQYQRSLQIHIHRHQQTKSYNLDVDQNFKRIFLTDTTFKRKSYFYFKDDTRATLELRVSIGGRYSFPPGDRLVCSKYHYQNIIEHMCIIFTVSRSLSTARTKWRI